MTTPYGPTNQPQGRPPHGPPPQGQPPQGPPQQQRPGQRTENLPPVGAPPGFGPGATRQHGPQQGPFPPPHNQAPPNQPPPNQPPGFGGPWPTQPATPASRTSTSIWTLGLVSLVAVVAGLSIEEDGNNAWHSVHAWGGLAIVGALLTLAPVVATNLGRQRAWQVSVCGAGALILFWVLFVLPDVGSNTSLATTVGVATGLVATWIAPGRDQPIGPLPPGGRPRDGW